MICQVMKSYRNGKMWVGRGGLTRDLLAFEYSMAMVRKPRSHRQRGMEQSTYASQHSRHIKDPDTSQRSRALLRSYGGEALSTQARLPLGERQQVYYWPSQGSTWSHGCSARSCKKSQLSIIVLDLRFHAKGRGRSVLAFSVACRGSKGLSTTLLRTALSFYVPED